MLFQYPFKSQYFSVGDHRLHYVDEGSGPVVVLVHGNPTWSYFYRNLIAELSEVYRVIAIDHIGCGLSDKPQKYAYTLANHMNNLSLLLEHLNIGRRSFIVHDWGGAIGMGVATQQVELVEKIIVLNTAAFRSRRIPFRIRICRLPYVGPLLVRGLNGFAWPATFMAVARKQLPHEVKQGYLYPYDTWANRVAISAFVQDIPLEPDHQSYTQLREVEMGLDRLKDADVPLLILWGGKDFCFNHHFLKEWQKRFPEAESHLFPEAGHYLLEDEPEKVHAHVKQFLGRQ